MNAFNAVCAHLLERRQGLSLSQLATADAIARDLDFGRNDTERLGHLCAKAGTSVRALRSHLAGGRQGAVGEQLPLFGGPGVGPDPASLAPRGSSPRARATDLDWTESHDARAA